MRKSWVVILLSILVIGLVAGVIAFSGDSSDEPAPASVRETTQPTETNDAENGSADTVASNSIRTYSEANLAQSEADTNLIFFHAVWCTVCNSVERSLEAGVIPDDINIYKVDFDSDKGQNLAEMYDIPIQYTMVQVNTEGEEITQWVNNFNDGIEDIKENIVQS